MNVKAAFLAGIGLASIVAPSQGAAPKAMRESIELDGSQRVFYLFVPAASPQAGGLPLLVLLHGSGRDGTSLIDKWKNLASKENVILVAPNSANPAHWIAPLDGPELLHSIVERLKTNHPVNPRRVYLFGHSAGAVFAIDMALLESNYFAAAAVHAGALRQGREAPIPRDLRPAMPLALFSGTEDPLFPITQVRATSEVLQKAGVRVLLKEIPHHDHDYYRIASKLNDEVWEFLKDQELPAEPKFERRFFH